MEKEEKSNVSINENIETKAIKIKCETIFFPGY
jgi:hypothetical protein